jgi:hypothetical protein
MTDYQTNYEGRFDGSLPNALGTTQSDQFTGTRPQLVDEDGDAFPGYAALDEKWQRFDPAGDVLTFAGVNTRAQMAEVLNAGVKNFVGFFQSLPLPAATGEVIERALYGRSSLSMSGENVAANVSGNYGGLFLADGDLGTDPETTTLHVCGVGALRGALDDTGLTGFGVLPVAATFVAFDALPGNPGAQSEAGVNVFWRIRTRQTCTAPATFTSEAQIDASANGADWMTVCLLPTAAALRVSFGFGVWCNDGFPGTLYQHMVQVVDQGFDDLATKIGDTLRLGPI